MIRFLLLILGTLCCFHANGQDSTLVVNLSLLAAGSDGPTPYWIYANKNGSIPNEKLYVSGQWGVYKIYNPNNPRLLQWSSGVELISNYGRKENIFFTDLYGAVKLGNVELMLGQKKNMVSLIDSTLGTGSLSVSGNSRPFPRFQLSVIEFHPLSFTGDYMAFKASFSDGTLGRSNINYGSVSQIPKTYFHQKQLYFRLGKSQQQLKAYIGINHQAIWGGENLISPLADPRILKSYWRVITGKTINYQKVGNHFGTIDLAAEYKISKWKLFVYRNNIYENGSLFKVINLSDGLNGITITNSGAHNDKKTLFSIYSVNVEYLSLGNQRNQFQPSGLVIYEIANYYNNYIYQRGWSYYGHGIGSALAPPSGLTQSNLPENSRQFTNNNRIHAFHTALRGYVIGVNILVKCTYTRNYGTYVTPFDTNKNQLSVFISGEKKINFLKLSVVTGLASDIGKLYPNSNSVFVGIRKSAFLN